MVDFKLVELLNLEVVDAKYMKGIKQDVCVFKDASSKMGLS